MLRKVFASLCWMGLLLCSVLPCLLFMPEDAAATVKPPVHVDFVTGWRAVKGGPTVHVAAKGQEIPVSVFISSEIDLEAADFELLVPTGMEWVSGKKTWSGALEKGQPLILETTIRITSDSFGVLRGRLFLPDFGVTLEGMLDLRDPAKTDRIPESGENRPVPPGADTTPVPDAVIDAGDGPDPVTPLSPEPHVELPDWESDIKQLGAGDEDKASKCTVGATGRMVYQDDHGAYIGIHGARVILWDSDTDADDECARGVTDWNGYYALSGSCSDIVGNPDIYVQNYAVNTNYAQVGSPYSSVNPTIDGFCGTYDYGTMVVPDGHRGAYQLYNQAVEAHFYIDSYDSPPPMIQVNWPASGSGAWYNGQIYITDTTPWFEPTLYHEYGHFVMDTYAALPTFNYCNGICDASPTDCGHCLWHPENGYIHHMEGWPDFFADLQSDYWNRDDFYGFETHDAAVEGYSDSDKKLIEGITAAILWDIYDSSSDNQHGDQPRDNLSLGFDEIWNITTNYDPGGTYDYPMTIDQFWTGFYNTYSGYRQGLWSVYAEHHINKDSTDPTNPSFVSSSHTSGVWSNDRTIYFSWSGANDNLSGVHGYGLYVSTSPTGVPATTVDTTATTYTTSSLGDGNSHYFHLRTVDNAGNWTDDVLHRGPYLIDGTPPAGSIAINAGAAQTSSPNVTLTLYATDGMSGPYQMRFANYLEPYSTWEPYGVSKSWVLKDLDGTRRVYVQYRDHAGNISNEQYDEILLERANSKVAVTVAAQLLLLDGAGVTSAFVGTASTAEVIGSGLGTVSPEQTGFFTPATYENLDGSQDCYLDPSCPPEHFRSCNTEACVTRESCHDLWTCDVCSSACGTGGMACAFDGSCPW